jgi:hypothetical protein
MSRFKFLTHISCQNISLHMTHTYRLISFHLQYLFNISCSTPTYFTPLLRYVFNGDRGYGYSQRVAIICDVSENPSTLKSAVFATITCSSTRRYLVLQLLVISCLFNCCTFCPLSLNPKIKQKVSPKRRQHSPLPNDQH